MYQQPFFPQTFHLFVDLLILSIMPYNKNAGRKIGKKNYSGNFCLVIRSGFEVIVVIHQFLVAHQKRFACILLCFKKIVSN